VARPAKKPKAPFVPQFDIQEVPRAKVGNASDKRPDPIDPFKPIIDAMLHAEFPGAPAKWSSFRPTGERLQKAQEIADHVAPGYKLDDQEQMVVVSARDAGVGSQQIQFVAVPGQNQYDIIAGANTIAYEMCGLGEHCSIRSGQPSTDRDRLLRREALEIALYTFKYVGSTDAVVLFMPPPVGAATSWALLFKKQNLGGELNRPITHTLAEPAPNPAALASSSERDLVEQLTGNARYSYKVQDVNGAPVLVLDVPST
jgi:hypothetical protein